MGILDNAGSAINRGISGTQRAAKTMGLKGQVNDLEKQREKLVAQLGASLYDDTRNLPAFRGPREELYSAIENNDAQRDELLAQIAQLESEAIAAANTGRGLVCPVCGKTIAFEDAFCMGCGTPVAQIKAQLHLCPNCGSQLGEGDAFCMSCGTPVAQAVPAASPAPRPVAAPEPVIQPEPAERLEPVMTRTPGETAPVEEIPAAEAPAEEVPAEETPAKEAPVEEVSMDEATSVEEPAPEAAPVEEAAPV